jgi:hypothetical protein
MGISIDAHDDFEDQWEDEAIEQSIEDAEIEADMERQDAEIKMEKHNGAGVKHYFKNGTEHKGATHKDAKGKVMSGKTHTASSKYLFHKKDLPTSATKKA